MKNAWIKKATKYANKVKARIDADEATKVYPKILIELTAEDDKEEVEVSIIIPDYSAYGYYTTLLVRGATPAQAVRKLPNDYKNWLKDIAD